MESWRTPSTMGANGNPDSRTTVRAQDSEMGAKFSRSVRNSASPILSGRHSSSLLRTSPFFPGRRLLMLPDTTPVLLHGLLVLGQAHREVVRT